MPAFFNDMERSSGIGDDRALQLALELSMLGFTDPLSTVSEPDSPAELGSFVNSLTSVGLEEVRSKKSQNMTECVPVPSSEHVAEIVGRQGKFVSIIPTKQLFKNKKLSEKNIKLAEKTKHYQKTKKKLSRRKQNTIRKNKNLSKKKNTIRKNKNLSEQKTKATLTELIYCTFIQRTLKFCVFVSKLVNKTQLHVNECVINVSLVGCFFSFPFTGVLFVSENVASFLFVLLRFFIVTTNCFDR